MKLSPEQIKKIAEAAITASTESNHFFHSGSFKKGVQYAVHNPGEFGLTVQPGQWVRASERTPKNDDPLHVKIDGHRRMGNFFDSDTGDPAFYVQENGASPSWIIPESKFAGIQWLDESQPQQTFSREEVVNFISDYIFDNYSFDNKEERREQAKTWMDQKLNTH